MYERDQYKKKFMEKNDPYLADFKEEKFQIARF
jgi:hypothetical protein